MIRPSTALSVSADLRIAEDGVVLGDDSTRVPGRAPSGVLVAILGWVLYSVVVAVLWHAVVDADYSEWGWIIKVSVAEGAFWALATPLIVWLARRAESRRIGLPLALVVHGVAAIACSVLMVMVRRWIVERFSPLPTGPLLPVLILWLDVHVLTYITVVIVTRALDIHRRYRDRAVRTHQLEMQLARAQMQFLELQLQPHFLFNCLNSVSELAHEAPDAAERMLRQLLALLRVSLERAGRDEVTLDEELAGLEPYVEIQRTRFSDWLSVEQRIAPAARDALVPHLILQPLVENAIRHGLAVRAGPGRVVIDARVVGDTLRLSVRDDGVGLAPARATIRSGIGLRNTRDRLRQLYDPDYRFVLRAAKEGGTIVELDMPIRRRDAMGRTPPLPSLDARGERDGAVKSEIQPAGNGRPMLALVPNGDLSAPLGVGEDGESQSAFVTGGWVAARQPSMTPPRIRVAIDVHEPDTPAPWLSRRTMLAMLGFWAAIGLFWSEQVNLAGLARGPGERLSAFRGNVLAAGLWAALTPLVLYLSRRFRLGRSHLVSRLALHLTAAAIFAFAHVAVVRLFNGSAYFALFDPANLTQLTGNLFIYFALLAWSHGRDFYTWYHERETASVRLESALARSRYQTLCVQLRPQFLLGTLELLTRMVHEDAQRAERLITRLADVLRLTLDTASDAETTLRRELELLRAHADVYQQGIRRGVHFAIDASPDDLDVVLPNRLVRTIVDDILATVPGNAGVDLRVEVERSPSATRIRVFAECDAPKPEHAGQPWSASVEAAALAEADQRVSLYFPDSRTALILLADRERANAGMISQARSVEAQPA